MNFYEVLGIVPTATPDEIKRSYRMLSMEKHPDKNPSTIGEYKSINEAYETLKNVDTRNAYDCNMSLRQDVQIASGIDEQLNTLFSDMLSGVLNRGIQKGRGNDIDNFAAFFGMPDDEDRSQYDPSIFINSRHNSAIYQGPEDLLVEQTITYDQAYNGCYIPINIEREIVLSNRKSYERETIYVDIHKGVDENEILTLEKKGNIRSQIHGDLKVKIILEENLFFSRNGINLILHKTISFKESLCGFKFEINHLNGKSINFSSSKGNVILNGDTKIIHNRGFTRKDVSGDLVIFFHVSQPNKLDDEQLKVVYEIF